MEAPLALYRRYRPETFAEVIGQEHVTDPLRHALEANRVNHAYLFSGPRGCGKTTSARILARTLNCEQAPVADPCGQCQSCRDLARGGPGSIDVIEIDAASHGGVDDARDLRERAFFAPVNSRYKVYIIDEAHMVSAQGFNALLKLVEEPPPHLKFIFATTEPDKVIGTIRSRTHHYPFRLVPPRALGDYLTKLCQSEGAQLEPTALPLVVRAGAGSVRDSLSVLDQLLAGADEQGLTYELAVQLLGYTPDALLDEIIDAFAAGDGATVFAVVDKVIESGQDPRRFAEDLLQRLRDLVVLAAVPSALSIGLLDLPQDRAERLQQQVSRFSPAELTRVADLVNDALVEFRGATAPRLLLELMCARVLVPSADNSAGGYAARIERLERRLSMNAPAGPAADPLPAASAADTARSGAEVDTSIPEPSPSGAADNDPAVNDPEDEPAFPEADAESAASEPSVARAQAPVPAAEPVASRPEHPQGSAAAGLDHGFSGPEHVEPSPAVGALDGASEPAAQASDEVHMLGIADIRRLWPQVLDEVKNLRRFTWIMLSQNAQITALEGNMLTLSLVNAGARDSFLNSGSAEFLQQALHQVFGGSWRIDAIVDPTAAPNASTPSPPSPLNADAPAGSPGESPARANAPADDSPATNQPPTGAGAGSPADPGSATSASSTAPGQSASPSNPEGSPTARPKARGVVAPESVRQAMSTPAAERIDPDASADLNDPVIEPAADPEQLLSRELGARVIDEFKHD